MNETIRLLTIQNHSINECPIFLNLSVSSLAALVHAVITAFNQSDCMVGDFKFIIFGNHNDHQLSKLVQFFVSPFITICHRGTSIFWRKPPAPLPQHIILPERVEIEKSVKSQLACLLNDWRIDIVNSTISKEYTAVEPYKEIFEVIILLTNKSQIHSTWIENGIFHLKLPSLQVICDLKINESCWVFP